MVAHVLEQKTLLRKAVEKDGYTYGWLFLKKAANFKYTSIEFELNTGSIGNSRGPVHTVGSSWVYTTRRAESMVLTLGLERDKYRFEFHEGPDRATTDRLMIQVQTAIKYILTPRSERDFIGDMKDSDVWSEFLTESFDILRTDDLVEN